MDEFKKFFLYAYLKITEKDTKEEKILKCAKTAYLDLCRTLRFNDENHENFSKDMSAFIKGEIISKILKLEKSIEESDAKHAKVCIAIRTEANNKGVLKEDFTYGQAQKWLNMTLKYMYLIGCWSVFFEKHKEYMHIPVDSIIIEAARDDLKIDEEIPKEPWSKWDNYNMYLSFQKAIRDNLNSSNFTKVDTPLEWEAKAWIEYASRK